MNGNDIDCELKLQEIVDSILDEDDTTAADSNSQKEFAPTGFQIKYKTEKCRYWTLGMECPFKDHCTFAHGNGELRDKQHVSKKYKTKVCLNFERTGCCKYGDRCQFLHPVEKPRVCSKQTHNNLSFCDILTMLPGEMSLELGLPTRRLKVFEKFEVDSFEGVDWRWKKNRLYSI